MNPPGARAKRQQVDRASRAISRDRTRIKLEVVALSKADYAANRRQQARIERNNVSFELLLAATIAFSKAQYRHNRRRIRGLRLRYHTYSPNGEWCYCVRCCRCRATSSS